MTCVSRVCLLQYTGYSIWGATPDTVVELQNAVAITQEVRGGETVYYKLNVTKPHAAVAFTLSTLAGRPTGCATSVIGSRFACA